jgi:erythromycin esterase-like protein
MAANALAQLDRVGPETKAVIWAHNAHISLQPPMDGSHLRARLGPAYRALGFALGHGHFNAGGVPVDAETGRAGPFDWTLRPHPAQPPPPGSLEHLLDQLDLDRYAVETALVEALDQELPVRGIGAVVAEGPVQFSDRAVPATMYDLLVYFRTATPSHLLWAHRPGLSV